MEAFVIYTDKTEKDFECHNWVKIWSLVTIQVFLEPLNDYACNDSYWAVAFDQPYPFPFSPLTSVI